MTVDDTASSIVSTDDVATSKWSGRSLKVVYALGGMFIASLIITAAFWMMNEKAEKNYNDYDGKAFDKSLALIFFGLLIGGGSLCIGTVFSAERGYRPFDTLKGCWASLCGCGARDGEPIGDAASSSGVFDLQAVVPS